MYTLSIKKLYESHEAIFHSIQFIAIWLTPSHMCEWISTIIEFSCRDRRANILFVGYLQQMDYRPLVHQRGYLQIATSFNELAKYVLTKSVSTLLRVGLKAWKFTYLVSFSSAQLNALQVVVLMEYHFYFICYLFHTLSLSVNSVVMTCIETQLGVFYHINRTQHSIFPLLFSNANWWQLIQLWQLYKWKSYNECIAFGIFCDIHQHIYPEKVGDLMVSVQQMKEVIYGWYAFQWNLCIYWLSHACIPLNRFILQSSA